MNIKEQSIYPGKGLRRDAKWYGGNSFAGSSVLFNNNSSSTFSVESKTNTKTDFKHYNEDMYQMDFREFCLNSKSRNGVADRFATDNDNDEEWLNIAPLIITKPPEGYICHNCNQPGHFIKFCQKNAPSVALTNYQGNKRSVGCFRCKCGNDWLSQNSFSQKGQRCRKCSQICYPFKQYSMEKAIEHNIFSRTRRVRNGSSYSSSVSECSSLSASPFRP